MVESGIQAAAIQPGLWPQPPRLVSRFVHPLFAAKSDFECSMQSSPPQESRVSVRVPLQKTEVEPNPHPSAPAQRSALQRTHPHRNLESVFAFHFKKRRLSRILTQVLQRSVQHYNAGVILSYRKKVAALPFGFHGTRLWPRLSSGYFCPGLWRKTA